MIPRPKNFAQDGAAGDQIITRGSVLWGPGNRPTFGTEYQEAESLGVTNGSGTSWVQKLRMTTTTLPAGNYIILFDFQWMEQVLNTDNNARIQIDDSSTPWEMFGRHFGDSTGLGHYHPGGGFVYQALSVGSHNIDMDFSGSFSSQWYAREAKIKLWRIS